MNFTWAQVESLLEKLGAQHDFTFQTLENARDFIRFAAANYLAPEDACEGYFPTLRLMWSFEHISIEIEIHAYSYELYQFVGSEMDILAIDHSPSEPFPERLDKLLRPILAKGILGQVSVDP